MMANEPRTSVKRADLEWRGVGWLLVLHRDLPDLLDREAADGLRETLSLFDLVAPDGSLTERGEEARRAALRLLAERQVSPARIEALAGGDVARWAAMAERASAVPDTGHSQACSCGECGRMWARGKALQEVAPELVRTAVPALCAEVARLRAALDAAGAWLSLPDAIRDQVTADMRCAAPLQSASDRPTTDAWEAGIRCLEAGRPRVTALELAERARLRAADPQRALVQQIAEHAPAVHSDIAAAVEAQNPGGLTAEQREQVGHLAALVQASAYTCITGRPEDAARAFAGLLGAAGESEDGRRGAARALRHLAAVLEGQPVPETTAEQDMDALRIEWNKLQTKAIDRLEGTQFVDTIGHCKGIRRALDVLAPHLPPPRSAR